MGQIMAWIYYFSLPFFLKNSINGIHVQTILLLALSFCIFGYSYSHRIRIRYSVWYMLSSLFFVAVWGGIGFLCGFEETVFDEALNFLNFFAGLIVSYCLIDSGIVSHFVVRKILISLVLMYISIKGVAFLLDYLNIFTLKDSIQFFNDVSGGRLAYSKTPMGFLRVSTVGDVLVYFLYGLYGSIGKIRKVFLVFCLMLPLTVSLTSRYFWGMYIFFSVAIFIIRVSKNHRSRIMLWMCVCLFMVLVFGGIAALGEVGIYEYFAQDVLGGMGRNVARSDAVRMAQSLALIEGFWEHPILGLGLGGFLETCIRDKANPFNYEMWYLACLMKFGFVGTILIVAGNILNIIRDSVFRAKSYTQKYMLLFLYGGWALLGVFIGTIFHHGGVLIVLLLDLFYNSDDSTKEKVLHFEETSAYKAPSI